MERYKFVGYTNFALGIINMVNAQTVSNWVSGFQFMIGLLLFWLAQGFFH